MIVVVTTDIENLKTVDWRTVDSIILVNIGQPDYINIKRQVITIARDHLFNEPRYVVVFPPVDHTRVTHQLLEGIGLLYSDDVEVIDNGRSTQRCSGAN